MRLSSAFRLIVVLGLLAAVLAGCSRDPNVRKQKYFKSGQSYFEKGQYREAAIQFSNAVRVDPNYGDAHHQLAQTYLRLQQWLPAYQELSRTLELQPGNDAARIDLANLLVAGHDLQHAQEHIDLLLPKLPNDPRVHLAAANLLAAQNNVPAAIQEMQKAITLAPNRSDSYLSMAVLQMRANQFDLAEANLKKAIDLDPKALNAQLALGGFYQSRNRLAAAEQVFRHAMQVDPKSPDPRAALARLLMAQGKRAETEDLLKQAKQELADNPAGYRMLGDFYFAAGDLDKATAEYSSLFQEHPKDLQVKKNYIQLLILKGRLDEAAKLNNEVLASNANDTDCLIYRGQIQIRQGKARDAIPTLQTAIKNDPDNGVAHYHLGVAFDQQSDLARAESEWHEAVRLRPDLIDAQRALAAAAFRRGDMSSVEQIATQIISLQPASPEGYALRSASFINRKRFANAEQDANKAVEIAANSPIGYIRLGDLHLAQKEYAGAEKAYRQALDRDPSSPDALAGLMNTCIAGKQIDKALAAANEQIVKVPNSSVFYDLLGTALFNNKKDLNGAEAALKKSAELDKKNSDALLKLGQVQAAKGSIDEAIATYQNSLRDNPQEVSFYILMGELYESKRDWGKAKEMYKKALDLRPENPLASNNLAYVMLQAGENVDMAMSLAQIARRGMPESPNAADTLGWVYYQKAMYDSAIGLFQEAVRLNSKANRPPDATFHYHLGLAYQKTGQTALARKELESVLQINPKFGDAGDVKKVLAELR